LANCFKKLSHDHAANCSNEISHDPPKEFSNCSKELSHDPAEELANCSKELSIDSGCAVEEMGEGEGGGKQGDVLHYMSLNVGVRFWQYVCATGNISFLVDFELHLRRCGHEK
jgi:hypothetical protein